ncbi:putative leucine-rich repeat receptor-like serine/threonine-protein kinase At2g24130 [Cryptomeria japonica]|uniref:putative leucine-rich repeat receptor-like serine/threonine-protein kinase At2g24130 n=1 Tax=Cryptomeria japonica TaxID=3369 RepID=UPI0027DA81A5|nr:putative leucine-rich repeat receptor-like serine/threonine-protein kinase At2g24130 [Cryptomeria japonica]
MSIFPLLLVLFSCLLSSDCFTTDGSHHSKDQQSLLAFKSSLIFPPNHPLSNWTVDIPFCKWAGVICDRLQERVLSLNLSAMGLQGFISSRLTNMSFLETIDLSANALNGSIPPLIGSLSQLKYLSLRGNRLGGNIPSSLVGLSALVHLDLGHNMLSGQIPDHIANLTSLTLLDFSVNHLNSTIPSLKGLKNLERLFLQKNQFVGTIPDALGQLQHLHLLKISHNKLSGRIPESVGKLRQLRRLFLHHNHLSDLIPASLGSCKKLQVLDLSHNCLTGSIPQEVANLSHIKFYVNLSFNLLEGALPQEIGRLVKVQAVDISRNRLSGVIPETLGNCTELRYLNLSRNGLKGTVANPLGNLQNLRYLDLSSNFLSGTIPPSLKGLKFLLFLNLSFNCLAVDEDGGKSFVNSSAIISLIGNLGLLGSNASSLPACGRQNSFKGTPPLRTVMERVAVGAFGITAFIYILGFVWTRRLDIRTFYLWSLVVEQALTFTGLKYPKISYEEIERATAGFSDDNLLGKGNFGSVYKGILDDGRDVAVKVFDSTNKNAFKNFTAECKALRNVRHRNVVKIITTCSTNTFNGLIFEFMHNGSLEKNLYHPSCELGLRERLNIALDVAHAIEYLHHRCEKQIVHCDIKPSNVLLSKDLVAYLSDFGIAKLMDKNSLATVNFRGLKGTIGYISHQSMG